MFRKENIKNTKLVTHFANFTDRF